MTKRPVFGQPLEPEPPPVVPPCKEHVLDVARMTCVNCGWRPEDVPRCAVVACPNAATYETEVEDKETGKIVSTAFFCEIHAFSGGIAMIPGGPTV